ncbi:hypothetical protein BP6252_13844 [Coleophoma cylindrospora]|uniref:Zn(2)-C6 fungal-type domain-containing protein n=1 Tax=Coleophoma cylindrospora TaxID=1849047 RepID=A0A3D8Q627_9HELO|nr:hypothetical protein BP6252_13844 [Coleophoma cylindrospora]
MSLGPQCWSCRSRRVRCDSHQPQCRKCTTKNIECLGYSEVKPLQWKQGLKPVKAAASIHRSGDRGKPYPATPASSESTVVSTAVLSGLNPVGGHLESLNTRIILEAVKYYNEQIAPDLVPVDSASNFYRTSGSKWMERSLCELYLQVCIVETHQKWKQLQHSSRHGAVVRPFRPAASTAGSTGNLYHFYYEKALQVLQQKINQPASQISALVLSDILLFIFCQLQQSSFFSWKVHWDGAQSLVNLLGGYEALVVNHPHLGHTQYFLLCIDVFAATTMPSAMLAESGTNQALYLDTLQHLHLDTSETACPIPHETMQAIIHINILRLRRVSQPPSQSDTFISPGELLSRLFDFDIALWTSDTIKHRLAVHTASDSALHNLLEGYKLLGQVFQAATILYGVRSLELDLADILRQRLSIPSLFKPEDLVDPVLAVYSHLISTLHHLFRRKSSGDVFWKFCLWPMVIAGQQSALNLDKPELAFLCQNLHVMCFELGAGSMQDAAYFLSSAYERQAQSVSDGCDEQRLSWDAIFEKSPLFFI